MNGDKESRAYSEGIKTHYRQNAAFLMAVEILQIFVGVLREDEHQDALCEIAERIREGLLTYETNADRRMQRLTPGRN